MYETYLQNEREWEEEFGTLIDWGDGDLITKEQLKSKNRLSRIKEMKALEKELEESKTIPVTGYMGDSHITSVQKEAYNTGLQLSLDKIREFIKLLEKEV